MRKCGAKMALNMMYEFMFVHYKLKKMQFTDRNTFFLSFVPSIFCSFKSHSIATECWKNRNALQIW